ncbi:MAG: VWA domain-containing protein, partial [Acidobacteria bacterium]|nr:VWA domain-containing protein [Acidobacteriota bacterium]
MAFLAPLFLLGLGALAVPVIIHMIQRERKEVVEFPSLMFVRKIPFHSFRRQRIRHWFLLLLRCAAFILLIAAFARPFFQAPTAAAVTSGAREVVVLLDRSYSMAYADRWDRAQAAAADVIDGLGADDRATLIFFDSGAEVGPRSMTDRGSLRALVDTAELGAGTTRYGPALKLAEGIFEDSSLPRLEAVLISDFQQSGLDSASGIRFPEGTVVTPVAVGEAAGANVSVAGVLFQREYFSGRERVAVSARVTNRGDEPVAGLTVALELEGRELETLATDLPANGASTASGNFDAADLAGRQVVILTDTPPPSGAALTALQRFVEGGGGLLVVSGERSAWTSDSGLLPGTIGSPLDRDGRGGAIGFVDYSHPVFELFSAPRSGDVTTARFFRYRPLDAAESAVVLARYDDGNPVLAERRVGSGTVLLWASTLDSFWNDLALKPVYLPFVHRVVQHLAGYVPPTPWYYAGQVLDLEEQGGLAAMVPADTELVGVSPAGRRVPVTEGQRAGFLALEEQGLYEIHDATAAGDSLLTLAVNVDLQESDLTAVDPEELASAVTGRAAGEREAAAAPARTFS